VLQLPALLAPSSLSGLLLLVALGAAAGGAVVLLLIVSSNDSGRLAHVYELLRC
jgi:hypothetical protein